MEDVQDQLHEETRQKLAFQTKLRDANEEANRLQEQLELEEDDKNTAQKALSQLSIQVGGVCTILKITFVNYLLF